MKKSVPQNVFPMSDCRTQDARRLRELGHLQLSVSDCQGAAQLFAKSQEMGNSHLEALNL